MGKDLDGMSIVASDELQVLIQQPDPSRTIRSPAAFRDRVRRTAVAGMQALRLHKNRPVSLPRSL
jgi:hypothetical protein